MTPKLKTNLQNTVVFAPSKPIGVLAGLVLLSMVAACGGGSPQINPSTRTSTDPVLTSVIASFRSACIESAPAFSKGHMNSGFYSAQPALAPGMVFVASGEPGRSCRVTVRGYGINRPKPTVGDVNLLGRALQARVGGTFKPKSADTGAGSAQVRVNRLTYNVFAFVGNNGDLGLSVFE